ncbi:MAG: DJ-1/PfpI family protein [Rhodospirillales bacterium]|nr:DJ-1/PfpI family protein [Rhodospirillales bacterium]
MNNNKSLSGTKIALLLANGFYEPDVTAAQRALLESGATLHIISPDQGLVNGWTGESWGHHFMVDQSLSTALGADYDMLVLPGGQRSMDKLMLTAHTKRFITSFMNADKPVAVFGEAADLLVRTDNAKGRKISGPVALFDMMIQAGVEWQDETPCFDGALMSGDVSDDNRAAFITAMMDFFVSHGQQGDDKAEKAA